MKLKNVKIHKGAMFNGHRPNPNITNPIWKLYLSPTPDDEIKSKIGIAFRNNGIILLKLDEISDEWLRAKLKDYMVKLYGESV